MLYTAVQGGPAAYRTTDIYGIRPAAPISVERYAPGVREPTVGGEEEQPFKFYIGLFIYLAQDILNRVVFHSSSAVCYYRILRRVK